jgi:uncharacterized membrane protein (UPF0127 family)
MELERTMRLPEHPICPRYRVGKAGAPIVDREAARLDFYKVGSALERLAKVDIKIPELTNGPVIFTSSYAKAPYPLALAKEFNEVRNAACENNIKKARLIAREASRRKQWRELSSTIDSLAKEHARLKRFARENCARKGRDSSLLKTVQIKVGDKRLRVEVARTIAEQERGLMDRTDLPNGTGMLFEYAAESELVFWMKNTKLALDIGFFDAKGVLLNIESMNPDAEGISDDARPRYRSKTAAKYALEVPKGWFQKNGISPGALLDIKKLK